MTLTVIVAFIGGLIIGSFLNVVTIRFNTGTSLSGRSGCMSCRATLVWYELLPVVSFFVQRGRCLSCGSRISHQYWVVELATAFLFALIALQSWSVTAMLFAACITSILVAIAVYDIRHTIIPDGFVYLFGLTALLLHAPFVLTLTLPVAFFYSIEVFVSGIAVAAPLFFLWCISRGDWMGLGDVKLALGIGWALGVAGGFTALVLAFVSGAVIGVTLLVLPQVIRRLALSAPLRQFTMKSEVPFAPFLILGFFLVFFFSVDILNLVALFLY